MTAPRWTQRLAALGASAEQLVWCSQYPTITAAWRASERGDWMLQLAGACAGPPESASGRRVTLAACACARLGLAALALGEDDRRFARKFLRLAESWARRQGATLEEIADPWNACLWRWEPVDIAVESCFYGVGCSIEAAVLPASSAVALARCARIVRKHHPRPPRLPKEKP